MSFVGDLPWTWIAAAATVAAVVWGVVRYSSRGRGLGQESRSGAEPGHGSAPGAPAGDQRALLTAANEVRTALDRQAREMGELRAAWSGRLEEMERKIDALVRAQPPVRESAAERRTAADGGGYGGYGDSGGVYDSAVYGADSLRLSSSPQAPAWSPGPGDQPVEVRDGVLVASRSLPPAGYLSATGAGQARVYLNADAQLTEFSLPKWAAFFDLQGARPYAAYRTVRPAEVRWDEGAGRGELISRGVAEAI